MLNLAEHVFPLCKIYASLLSTLDFVMMDKSTTLAVQTRFVHQWQSQEIHLYNFHTILATKYLRLQYTLVENAQSKPSDTLCMPIGTIHPTTELLQNDRSSKFQSFCLARGSTLSDLKTFMFSIAFYLYVYLWNMRFCLGVCRT